MIDIADNSPITLVVIAIYIACLVIALLYKDQLSLAIRTLMEDGSAERYGRDRNRERDAARSRPENMDDYRFVLGRVGFVLMVAGSLVASCGIYSIGSLMDNNQDRLGNPIIMTTIVAGVWSPIAAAVVFLVPIIFLLRGSLQAARVVAWLAALELVVTAGWFVLTLLLLPQPLLTPLDFWLTAFRLSPAAATTQFLGAYAPGVLLLWMSVWVYRQLRTPSVLAAQAAIGRTE